MSLHYETLEIDRLATQDDVKKAYRRQALKYHPDKNSALNAEEMFKKISEAYRVLSDPAQRREYDRLIPRSYARESTYMKPSQSANGYYQQQSYYQKPKPAESTYNNNRNNNNRNRNKYHYTNYGDTYSAFTDYASSGQWKDYASSRDDRPNWRSPKPKEKPKPKPKPKARPTGKSKQHPTSAKQNQHPPNEKFQQRESPKEDPRPDPRREQPKPMFSSTDDGTWTRSRTAYSYLHSEKTYTGPIPDIKMDQPQPGKEKEPEIDPEREPTPEPKQQPQPQPQPQSETKRKNIFEDRWSVPSAEEWKGNNSLFTKNADFTFDSAGGRSFMDDILQNRDSEGYDFSFKSPEACCFKFNKSPPQAPDASNFSFSFTDPVFNSSGDKDDPISLDEGTENDPIIIDDTEPPSTEQAHSPTSFLPHTSTKGASTAQNAFFSKSSARMRRKKSQRANAEPSGLYAQFTEMFGEPQVAREGTKMAPDEPAAQSTPAFTRVLRSKAKKTPYPKAESGSSLYEQFMKEFNDVPAPQSPKQTYSVDLEDLEDEHFSGFGPSTKRSKEDAFSFANLNPDLNVNLSEMKDTLGPSCKEDLKYTSSKNVAEPAVSIDMGSVPLHAPVNGTLPRAFTRSLQSLTMEDLHCPTAVLDILPPDVPVIPDTVDATELPQLTSIFSDYKAKFTEYDRLINIYNQERHDANTKYMHRILTDKVDRLAYVQCLERDQYVNNRWMAARKKDFDATLQFHTTTLRHVQP